MDTSSISSLKGMNDQLSSYGFFAKGESHVKGRNGRGRGREDGSLS